MNNKILLKPLLGRRKFFKQTSSFLTSLLFINYLTPYLAKALPSKHQGKQKLYDWIVLYWMPMEEQFVDIIELFQKISSSSPQMQKLYQNFADFLQKKIIYRYKDGGTYYGILDRPKNFCGINIWLPYDQKQLEKYSVSRFDEVHKSGQGCPLHKRYT